MTDLLEPGDVPSAIPISDLECVRDILGSSLEEVTGQPKGNRKLVDMSGTMLVTISKGDISPEIGDALAVWIHDCTAKGQKEGVRRCWSAKRVATPLLTV